MAPRHSPGTFGAPRARRRTIRSKRREVRGGPGVESAERVSATSGSGSRKPRQLRARADDVESRATRTGELAWGRHEAARVNVGDRGGQLRFELGQLSADKRPRDGLSGPLEEDVGHLDLSGPSTEGSEGIHEPLEGVVALHRLLR